MQNSIKTYWQSAVGELKRVRSLTGASLLAALGIALKSATITFTTNLRMGFSFLAVALSGYLYGPVVAGLAGSVVDMIGFFLLPSSGGPYFFGFTLNAFLSGFLYGLWLHKKKMSLLRVFAACLTSTILFSFLLNPLWLHIMYGDTWLAFVVPRIAKSIVSLPLDTTLLFFLLRYTEKHKHLLFRN